MAIYGHVLTYSTCGHIDFARGSVFDHPVMMEYKNTYCHYGSHIVGSAHGMLFTAQPSCSQGSTTIRVPGPTILPAQQSTQVRAILTD